MEDNKTLEKNKINQFLLRIDLDNDSSVKFNVLAEKLRNLYDSITTQNHINYNVNVEAKTINREDFLKYILSTNNGVKLILDSFEKTILIESNQYINNSVYKERLNTIVKLIGELAPETKSKRIGMRYINVFNCPKSDDISKILTKNEASAIKNALTHEQLARTMFIHEYQYGDCMSRIQFGVPNKFYPSVIKYYDLVLDIDVYCQGTIECNNWENCITEYNHLAYDLFIQYVKDTYISSLR